MAMGVDRNPPTQAGDESKASGWLGAILAWLVAVPVTVLTLVLEWGLARDYGDADAGQYILVLPSMALVAVAVYLTLRAMGLRRWAPGAAVVSVLLVGGAALGAAALGLSARDEATQQACSAQDIEVLGSLPMFEEAGGTPVGYPDGGCYLRYEVPGDWVEASADLIADLADAGWVVRSEGIGQDPTIFVKDGVELYAEVEGIGNLEEVESPEGVTAFRLALFQWDQDEGPSR